MERMWDRDVVVTVLTELAPQFDEALDELVIGRHDSGSMVRDAAPAAVSIRLPTDAVVASSVREDDVFDHGRDHTRTDLALGAESSA
jgi:hypothetical protein